MQEEIKKKERAASGVADGSVHHEPAEIGCLWVNGRGVFSWGHENGFDFWFCIY